MRKEIDKDQILISEVKEKLDWYINEATEEEYDEKAVASLEYLLDTMEPVDKAVVDEEKAWEQFRDYVAERQHLDGIRESTGEEVSEHKKPGKRRTKGKKTIFLLSRGKAIVAAVLLIVVLTVSVGMQSEAIRDQGFFHWIKNVVGGREMVTSPDDLDELIESSTELIIGERKEVPEKWKDWCAIEEKVMDDKELEWKYIEIRDYTDKSALNSHYSYKENVIIIGAECYANKIIREMEQFAEFSFMETMTTGDATFDMGKKTEENGDVIYKLEFFGGNYRYYIYGHENVLDKIKELVVDYRKMIENYGF